MIWSVSLAILWRPYFPPIVTGVAVMVLLALAGWGCVRSFRDRPGMSVVSLLMRGVLIVLLGVVLMGPSGLDRPTASAERPVLRVMIDTSASMQVADVAGVARFEYAARRWLSEERLNELRQDYDVELYGFDDKMRAIRRDVLDRSANESAGAGISHIADAVMSGVTHTTGLGTETARFGPGGSAVLVLSDGRDSLGAPMHPVGQAAQRRRVPIHTVALGGPSLTRDVAVIASPQQPYLFAEEPGVIRVRVMQSNAGRDRTVLRVAGDGRARAFPVAFEGRDTVTVDVPIVHERPGTYEYRVAADPVADEAETVNNGQPVFVDVTAKRLKVLILEGQPYWDTKFLAYALRRDSRIELTQITQLSPGRHETIVTDAQSSAGVPKSLAELAQFDVVILGRDIGGVLGPDAAALLPRYVSEHGGRIVFARGRGYDPGGAEGQRLSRALSVLEPVVFGAGVVRHQKIELEPAGAGFAIGVGSDVYDPDTVGGLMPTLLRLPEVVRTKAATRVLARAHRAGADRGGEGQPAIVTMPYGRGMVAAVLGDGLWTWGLSPRQRRAGGETFERFWMDMVRWLALGSDYQPGKDVTVRLSRRGVAVGDPIELNVVSRTGFEGMTARVIVDGPDGARVEPALEAVSGSTTRRRAAVQPDRPGVYRVRVITKGAGGGSDVQGEVVEAKFNAYDVDIERLYTSADRGALRTLSELSGGQCLDPEKPEALIDVLDRQREAAVMPATAYYLWDRGWALGLILVWAGAEWLLRRAGGLL